MSNYPDDFRGFPEERGAQPTSDERAAARERGDVRCDLVALCEKIGAQLSGYDLSETSLACFAGALCEELYKHPSFRSIFIDCGQPAIAYTAAEKAMIRAAASPAAKQEAAA